MSGLKGNYLFPEVTTRKLNFLKKNPHAPLISLGIGDTTQPIPTSIVNSLVKASQELGNQGEYSGYGPGEGVEKLREKIAEKLYNNKISPSDIFISDGAKCDIGRWQMLFGSEVSIAVQNPTYPVYLEGSIIQGVKKIISMPCTPENDFFPDLKNLERTDIIYFCSPNNPTGAVATYEQLEELVAFAKKNCSIIIFDSAYACFIQDESLPKSIYDIPGAKEVAIEIGSFSKIAGFTGVRLGWSVVPEELKFDDGFSVKADWNRLVSTVFNGASNIAQQGGIAILEDSGLEEVHAIAKFYLENGKIIKKALEALECEIYGGDNAPYLWVRFKDHCSWTIFEEFLEKFHLVTTPGAGFGSCGESFLRFTAFGHREDVLMAAERLAAQQEDLLMSEKVASYCL